MADVERFPFLFGTEYYRAPTPEPDCWEMDFRNMRDLGFNVVKYLVQWRWSHRAPDRFYFDDLDRLMDLAAAHDLKVMLNFLMDVSPLWLFNVHPHAKQVDINGHTVEPYVVGHRQIGGHPGPCYRHPGALVDRQRFLAATVEHFRGHPALLLWDVWNEPELCFPQRTPSLSNMVCYCPHCRTAFMDWLRKKYGKLDGLNATWGRCYESWDQVELPRGTGTFTDFIDWREFHLDTMAGEAEWRLETVRQLDPAHGRFLHVVPNCWFSAVTCADDFAMAKQCEVFAATMNGQPGMFQHVLSAGHGKICYNVESHVNFGSTDMHQRMLGMDDILPDFLPQLGAGVKGIVFWQYRAEVLGMEAPAWGLVKTDGTHRPVTEAVRRFWATIRPHASALRKAFPAPAEIGVLRSRKNEVFHFCTQGDVRAFNVSIEAYITALYWDNFPHRLVSGEMLAAGELDGLKLLIVPNGYYMTQAQADSLDRWVRAGGVLLSEAHLAAYNGTTGRHNRTVPGCGLAESWGIRETDSTSSHHLRLGQTHAFDPDAAGEDVRKALKEFGARGGKYFPIRMSDGSLVWGAHRYAVLAGDAVESLGTFDGKHPCIVRKRVGKGTVIYCGTNFGQAAERDPAGLNALVRLATAAAAIKPTGGAVAGLSGTVHVDVLLEGSVSRYAVVVSKADRKQVVRLRERGKWHGLFTGADWKPDGKKGINIPAGFADIMEIAKC